MEHISLPPLKEKPTREDVAVVIWIEPGTKDLLLEAAKVRGYSHGGKGSLGKLFSALAETLIEEQRKDA